MTLFDVFCALPADDDLTINLTVTLFVVVCALPADGDLTINGDPFCSCLCPSC